jgi:phosphatidylserine/phosphatidylglycerophosphate/cardiolipin synthase-like enzyme
VQLLRTYPPRKLGYPFAPVGERSVARAYAKVLERARSLVYVEDQYLWSREVAETFGRALRTQPQLRVVAVVPHVPDQDGAFSEPPNLIGRRAALEVLRTAGGDRVRLYGIENGAGTPVYVHAKACIVDDLWATVGSDNFNRRSWTYDSELSAAVFEEPDDDGGTYARSLRLTLAAEHLGRRADDISDLVDAGGFVAAFASAAGALQAWHDGGCRGERPPGQVRPAAAPDLSRLTRAWATPLYRVLYDPEGRPRRARRAATF